MAFYVGKGLQIAGLLAVAGALYIGLTRADALFDEILAALAGAALFYSGRLVEGQSSR